MKRIIILGLIFLLFGIVATGEQSSSSINWISRNAADSLYCPIDDCTSISTTYYPTNYTVVAGTHDGGNVSSIQFAKDGDYANISEGTGADPLTVIINFSNVQDFNTILCRVFYDGGSGHEIEVGLWDTSTDDYEEEYGEISDMDEFAYVSFNVYDDTDHINSGEVWLRFRHVDNGIANHNLHIDMCHLISGTSTVSTILHDGLSGRDNKSNHPWALPIDGSRAMSGDLNMTENNITNLRALKWSDDEDIQIGFNTSATGSNTCTAIGKSARCDGWGSMSLGEDTRTTISSAIAIGRLANSEGDGTISIGGAANSYDIGGSSVDYSICIGFACKVNSLRSLALGYNSIVTNDYGISIGQANTTGKYGVSIGENASAMAENSIAIGKDVWNDIPDSVKIGQNSIYLHTDGRIIVTDTINLTDNSLVDVDNIEFHNTDNIIDSGATDLKVHGNVKFQDNPLNENQNKFYFDDTNAYSFAEASGHWKSWARDIITLQAPTFYLFGENFIAYFTNDWRLGNTNASDVRMKFDVAGDDGYLYFEHDSKFFNFTDDVNINESLCFGAEDCISSWDDSRYWTNQTGEGISYSGSINLTGNSTLTKGTCEWRTYVNGDNNLVFEKGDGC